MKLFGKVALVTGAARRIGRAVALALADAGCDVAVHFHTSADEAAKTAQDVSARGRHAFLVEADLGDLDAAAALPDRVVRRFGRLDVLVNNAAIFQAVPLKDLTPAVWRRTLDINLIAPALIARAAAPHFAAVGSGRIVNITDTSAERPWKDHVAYCTSKAGLASLTCGLAKALAPHVSVNAVAPGVAEFPDDYPEAMREQIVEAVPMRRTATCEEIAAAVLYFVRDAHYVTGTVLCVDGGRSVAW